MALGVALTLNGIADPSLVTPDSVDVVEAIGDPASYRLQFGLQINDGDFGLLTDDRFGPGSDLGVIVKKGDGQDLLVRGPVVGQNANIVHGGGGSTLSVMGADQSIRMNRENKAVLWADQTDSAAVQAVIASYGFAPDVQTTATLHAELKHALVQRETDWDFVMRLARRNGYWFWLSFDALTGLTTAHFKSPPASDTPALELRINVPNPNVDQVALAFNVERAAAVNLAQLDFASNDTIEASIDASPLQGLASKGLAEIADEPVNQHFPVPVDDAGDLNSRGEAALIDHGWFVEVRLQAKASRLRDVIRAHTVVNLTGLGSRHSGHYLVAKVVHHIDADDHLMTADLIRNGWN